MNFWVSNLKYLFNATECLTITIQVLCNILSDLHTGPKKCRAGPSAVVAEISVLMKSTFFLFCIHSPVIYLWNEQKYSLIFYCLDKCMDLITGAQYRVLLHWRNLGNTLTAGNLNNSPIVSFWLLKGIQPPKSGLQALALLVVYLRINYGNLKILLMLKGI